MLDEASPLFLQIGAQIADDIADGTLPEGERVPSSNEFAAFYRINPATAAKGINVLIDQGLVEKRRGIGMFVSAGARERLLADRRQRFAEQYIEPMLIEARRLGMGHGRSGLTDAGEPPAQWKGVNMTATVCVRNLTRLVTRDQLALDEVTVDIIPNAITGLLGRNGAGKSTFHANRGGPRVRVCRHRAGQRPRDLPVYWLGLQSS